MESFQVKLEYLSLDHISQIETPILYIKWRWSKDYQIDSFKDSIQTKCIDET